MCSTNTRIYSWRFSILVPTIPGQKMRKLGLGETFENFFRRRVVGIESFDS